MPEVRLQKALADAGVASRRAAEVLIAAGRVTVDGSPASVGQRVDPERQAVAVDGRPIGAAARHVHLALDKPIGVTSTVSDRHAEQTVLQLVPPDLRRRAGRLFPVGRLDRDSEGLILLTNDGDWGQRLSHPSFGVEREYAVGLARPLSQPELDTLRGGIPLDEGLARVVGLRDATAPETAKLRGATELGPQGLTWYRVTLAQGWRRQLRRMFAAVGVPVARLVRVRIGTLRLDGMHVGEVRELTAAERDRLGRAAPADSGPQRPNVAWSSAWMGPARAARARSAPLPPPSSAIASATRACSPGGHLAGPRSRGGPGRRGRARGARFRSLAGGRCHRPLDPCPRRWARCHGACPRSDVDRHVSTVARLPEVRAALLPRQREIAATGRIIMAGRDIGTVVLPDADLHLWLEVSVDERARRRAAERGVSLESPEGASHPGRPPPPRRGRLDARCCATAHPGWRHDHHQRRTDARRDRRRHGRRHPCGRDDVQRLGGPGRMTVGSPREPVVTLTRTTLGMRLVAGGFRFLFRAFAHVRTSGLDGLPRPGR